MHHCLLHTALLLSWLDYILQGKCLAIWNSHTLLFASFPGHASGVFIELFLGVLVALVAPCSLCLYQNTTLFHLSERITTLHVLQPLSAVSIVSVGWIVRSHARPPFTPHWHCCRLSFYRFLVRSVARSTSTSYSSCLSVWHSQCVCLSWQLSLPFFLSQIKLVIHLLEPPSFFLCLMWLTTLHPRLQKLHHL